MNLSKNRSRASLILTTSVLSLSTLLLAGCSASTTEAPAAATAETQSAQAQGPRGVGGEIASVDGDLLQVQSTDSQTAVRFSADTAITAQVAASLSDVTVGMCITGRSGAPGADTDDTAALSTVAISAAVDGECGLSGGAPGGMPGGDTPEGAGPGSGELSEPPEPPAGSSADQPDAPTGNPEGDRPEGGFGGLTIGVVTAVSGQTITVETTTTADVTVDAATTFTKTQDATSDALVLGACVVATGEYDDETYAATAIVVSEAGEDGCTRGIGGAGSGGGAGGDRLAGAPGDGGTQSGEANE